MSGELDCGPEENSSHTHNMLNPRSRGLMLQQSVDRPSDQHMHATHGNNMTSSVVTSEMTSPKMHRFGDSVNASASKRTSHGGGSTNMVHETLDNLVQSKDSFIH